MLVSLRARLPALGRRRWLPALGRRRRPARAARGRPRGRRQGQIRLAALAGAMVLLLGGGFLWLRQSDLVKVETVRVEGLSGENAARIREALVAEGEGMSTLAVDDEALREAVANFPDVAAVRASADFPHGLTVAVTERDPIGAVEVDGRRVAVAPDGTLLTGETVSDRLPAVMPAARAQAGRLEGARAQRVVALLAAAPAPLRGRVRRAGYGARSQGLRVVLRDGPALIFGDATRLAAKWASAARVLADRDSVGAKYVDVRLPQRPAAGGLPEEPDAMNPPQTPSIPGQDSASTPALPPPEP